MRVLLVHNRYRSVGGEERHIDLLEEWLPRTGVDVRRFEVLSPTAATLLDRVRLGVTLAYRPAGGRLLHEVLRRERPDVVHFHNLFPLLTPSAIREARVHGARTVLTIHNYRFACPAGTLLRNGRIHEDCIEGSSLLCGLRNARGVWAESIAYGIALELQRRLRLLHRWVDSYIAPSHFVATMLARAGYPPARIHTIYHGTPVADAPSPDGNYGLYAGRLSPEKGIVTLLAASRLAPTVPLLIVGAGPLTHRVLASAGQHITFVGPVNAQRVAELRQGALFALMPSECFEGQPFGALESMAVGTPLIASSLGGLAEITRDGITGVLVPPRNPRALAGAMRAMWADKARTAEMGTQAWEYARMNFSAMQQARRLADLYQRLVPESTAVSLSEETLRKIQD